MIFRLKPILKHRLWDSNYLPSIFGQKSDDKIGEAWILSCIGDDNSPIDGNLTLLDVFNKNPNIVAKNYKSKFPLLIKLIEVNDDLSIQVHPKIKTEFWHILSNKPSKLYMRLNKDSNKEEVEQAIESGKITNLLNYIDVINGDSYLIKPGTIHAIGKSTFLIEIQQSADITYRLYDFNRVDSNGKHRQLHVKQALDCLDYKMLEIDKNAMQNGHLISCPYFSVYKYKIDSQKTLNATEKSFHSLTIIEGTWTIEIDGKKHQFKPYDSFFISAGSNSYKIAGNVTIILATL